MGHITDTRRLSPQTTSSSGYQSDLSLTNESPQSIPHILEQSTYSQIDKKTIVNNNFSRISSFIRKQYERAKSKLLPQKQILTCSKATSTTPLSYVSDNTYLKPSSCLYNKSSFIEPIYSVYVQPIYDNQIKIPFNESYSHRLVPDSSSSYRRLTTVSNHKYPNTPRCHSYSIKPTVCQNYYPYKYIEKNYNYNRLSDFVSTTNSAFKPIKSSQRVLSKISEQLPPSDDPCDLEVAQYFHKTSQWNNRNYFDIYYTNNTSLASTRKNYIETLC